MLYTDKFCNELKLDSPPRRKTELSSLERLREPLIKKLQKNFTKRWFGKIR